MTKIQIATVEACPPAPFTTRPFFAMVLESQVGTAARYVRMMPSDASLADMDAEARALEMTGEIDEADLAASWTFDHDAIVAEEAYAEGNATEEKYLADGMQPDEDEVEQELEPIA